LHIIEFSFNKLSLLRNASNHHDLERVCELLIKMKTFSTLNSRTFALISKLLKSLQQHCPSTKQSNPLSFFGKICTAGLERMIDALSCNPSISKLHLWFDRFGFDHADHHRILVDPITRLVRFCPTLTDLRIAGCRKPIGLMEMVKGLQNNTTIRQLDLRCNSLDKFEEIYVVALLNRNHTISNLNLCGNQLGDDAMNLLAIALSHNSSITRIIFSSNGTTAKGVKHLADAINRSVTQLVLSQNRGISEEGSEHLAYMLTCNSFLTTLLCSDCGVGESGLMSIAAAMSANTTLQCIDLSFAGSSTASKCDCFGRNSTLTSVVLRSHRIDAFGVKELCQGLQRNGSISTIDLSWNRFEGEGARCVAALLERNSVLTSLNISDCGIGRNGGIYRCCSHTEYFNHKVCLR
jgi:hypothetical protein